MCRLTEVNFRLALTKTSWSMRLFNLRKEKTALEFAFIVFAAVQPVKLSYQIVVVYLLWNTRVSYMKPCLSNNQTETVWSFNSNESQTVRVGSWLAWTYQVVPSELCCSIVVQITFCCDALTSFKVALVKCLWNPCEIKTERKQRMQSF